MIEEMKTFIAVVEENNFTRAGEKINLSQPSVSLHINKLEKYFDETLINRSSKEKKIHITENGKILHMRIKEILKVIEDTKEEFQLEKNMLTGKVKIGASFTVGENYLPKFIGKIKTNNPFLNIEVYIKNTKEILEEIDNLEMDFAIVEGDFDKSIYEYKVLHEDEMILACSKQLEEKIEQMKFADMDKLSWVFREEGSGTRASGLEFLKEINVLPKDILVMGSNNSIKEYLRYGLGITFISKLVVFEYIESNYISWIKREWSYKRKYYLVKKKMERKNHKIEVILKELEDIKKSGEI